MNCKICNYNNKEFSYILKNSKVFKCSNCGFYSSGYLDDEINIKKKEPVKLTDDYRIYLRKDLQSNKERFKNHVDISLKYFSKTENLKILDIGSGGGLYLSLMKQTFAQNINCYGIELDLARVKFAEEEYSLKNIHPEPVSSSFWDEHKNSFDLITLWDVIEHVNSPNEIIQRSTELLKENGILIMDTPCRDTFYHKFGECTYKLSNGRIPTFLNIMYSDHPFGHKQIFSEKEIKKLYKENGFIVTGFDVFHELSFPNRFYLKKLVKKEFLVNLLNPFVSIFLRLFRIKNKMLIEGKLVSKNN